MSRTYRLEPKSSVIRRVAEARLLRPESTRKQCAVRVIDMRAAHSQPVHDAIQSGYAVLITKNRKFHDYDLQALRACLGHLGKVSPVFKYGSQVAVLVHPSTFDRSVSLQFAVRYPIGKFVDTGVKVTSLVYVHEHGEFLSFSYRVNYNQMKVTEHQLRSLERNKRRV